MSKDTQHRRHTRPVRPVGRPRVDEADLRKPRTAIRWTDMEWQRVGQLAQVTGLSRSRYIREAALRGNVSQLVEVPAVKSKTSRAITNAEGLLARICVSLEKMKRTIVDLRAEEMRRQIETTYARPRSYVGGILRDILAKLEALATTEHPDFADDLAEELRELRFAIEVLESEA